MGGLSIKAQPILNYSLNKAFAKCCINVVTRHTLRALGLRNGLIASRF